MEPQLPTQDEAGYVISIHGSPRNYEDLRCIQQIINDWGFLQGEGASQNQNIEDVIAVAFDLPYGQGPGYLEIYLYPAEPPIPKEDDYFPTEQRTPHWATIGYADSMTSVFTSPIYHHNDDYFLGGM